MKISFNRIDGQSLLEVMVALSVLTIGFLGIFGLLAQSLHLSKNVSDNTIATYLASEGIELAKNIVDHDMYGEVENTGGTWGATISTGHDYQIDYTTCTSQGVCPPILNQGQFLCYDPTTFLYSYNCGLGMVQTPFQRIIRVTANPNNAADPNELVVDSIVTWSAGLSQNTIDLQDHFYNWHP